ncbi:unnamed protein product [Tilletia controversa]|nr:unnamed protein product [Tilletia controversa]
MATSAPGASTSAAGPSVPTSSNTGPGSAPAPAVTTKEEATARYLALKSSLKSGLAKKRQIDRTLTDIESQLWLFEGSYLAATASAGGNVVKGFDSYLKSSTGGGATGSSRTGGGMGAALGGGAGGSGAVADVPMEDRMFSLSSATYMRSLELMNSEGGLDKASSGGLTGSALAAAGLGMGSSSAANRQGSPADTSVEPAREESRTGGGGGAARVRKR